MSPTKIIIIFLCLILCCPAVFSGEGATVQITASKTSVKVGDIFTVDISLNSTDDITAWMIYELTYQPVGKIIIKNLSFGDSWNTSFSDLGSYNNAVGKLTNVQSFSTEPRNGVTNLITITFEAKNSGTVPITITSFKMQDNTAQDVPFSINIETISITTDGGNDGGGDGGGGGGGEPIEPTNNPPEAVLRGPFNITVNQSVLIDGSDSVDDNGIIMYYWNFGDEGNTSCVCPKVYHNYTLPGSYVVTLTVKDIKGLSDTTSASVFVSVPYVPDVPDEPEVPYEPNTPDEPYIPEEPEIEDTGIPAYVFGIISVIVVLLFLTYLFLWRKK